MRWRGDVPYDGHNRMVNEEEKSPMSLTLRTMVSVALAGLLCMAPLGMAAGPAAEKTPGASGVQVQPPTATLPSVPAGDRITATVEGVDQSKGTLKLRAADGERLEFKAPKGMLASLQQGDHVQIAIQKAPGTPERNPTGGTVRPQPEQPK